MNLNKNLSLMLTAFALSVTAQAQTPAPSPTQATPAQPAATPAETAAPAAENSPTLPAGTHPTAAKLVEQNPLAQTFDAPATKPVNDADLWQRIRRGFTMADMDSPLVQQHETWYSTRPDYIQRFVDRGSKYLFHVVEEVERRGMPMEVALLPIIESAFNPQAYSRAKAAGMWQFIPSTGKNFGLKQDWMADNRRDVLLSTHAALDYLEKLYGMFNSWELAFAAYNCGEGCVGRAIQKNERKNKPTDYLSLNLPPETRHYVPKLLAVKNIVLSPGSYGIELVAVHNRPYFAKVPAPARIDVKLAARLAEMPEDDFAALNPAFTKPVATSGTGYFLVPADKADTFQQNMELYRSLDGPMVSWQTASAKRGEGVDAVAKRYGLTASYLRATNGPLPEKKGKFTQPASFMVPMHKEAKIITATIEKKVALKAALPAPAANATVAEIAATALTEPATFVPASVVVAQAPAPVALDSTVATLAPAAAITEPVISATSHRVKSGDTLFAIAKRYGLTVEQLKSANSLSGNNVQIGQELVIAAATDGIVPAPAAGLVKVSAPARPAPARITTYTVRNGDTLLGIALKFGVELADLLRWNKLSVKSVLQPGNRLRVTD
jgi:membrane-bound lytic murein transglycosylase D